MRHENSDDYDWREKMYGIKSVKVTQVKLGQDKSKYTESEIELHKKIAKEFMDKGYRRVSRKHCILSRVDKLNWRNYMAKDYAPWSLEEGEAWVRSLGDSAADHYRRVYSHDKIQVPEEISRWIAPSDFDKVDFVK